MNLYLVRHGESTNNAGLTTMDDPPLTERGHVQATLAAKAFETLGVRRLYCSPMLRALETARPIVDRLGIPLEVRPELCEHGGLGTRSSNGRPEPIPGLSRSAILRMFPTAHLPDSIDETGWWRFVPKNEADLLRFTRRQMESLWELWIERHRDDPEPIGAVIHGRSGSILISTLFGLETDQEYARFAHHNCGIDRIEVTATRTRLVFLNRIDHLPAELIT